MATRVDGSAVAESKKASIMTRGLFILVLQMFICTGVTSLGLWALTRPKRLQHFINSNYALLPAARDDWQATPIFLRIFGIFLLWYGYTLAAGFHEELLFLGRLFGINS
jgi:hypothetical protein